MNFKQFKKSISSEVDQISDFVNDHYAQFGAYPMEVQTDNAVYTFDQYWSILEAAGRGAQ